MTTLNFRKIDLVSLVNPCRTVAIVGAGGKTSLMFFLAHRLAETGKKIITTTTTHIFAPTPEQSPVTVVTKLDGTLSSVSTALLKLRHVTVGREVDPISGKLKGVDAETILRCRDLADLMIVEADGAAGRSIKAPEAWEPVIPSHADLVVFTIGLDCLGQPVNEDIVFRLTRFCQITSLNRGDLITPEAIVRLSCHQRGGLKGVPTDASFLVFLNKLDRLSRLSDLKTIAAGFRKTYDAQRIFIAIAGNLIQGEFVVLTE